MRRKEITTHWAMLAMAVIHTALSAHSQVTTNLVVTGGGQVWALAAQPDAKILLGGYFQLRGQPFYHIARANADGSLDISFRPAGINTVTALAVQADGKILVGANVTNLAGQVVSILERLNADGSPDGTSVSGGPGDYVNALALQPDGKVLVGGPFRFLPGQPRANLARLNANGTLDTSFNPAIDASPYSIVVQPDGKILLGGGNFTSLDGQPRNGLGRLNADGTLDVGFNPSIGSSWAMALQSDGKIIVSLRHQLPTLTNSPVARLNPDGTLDATFNSSLRTAPDSLAVQTDGKILATGWDSGVFRLNQNGSLDPSFSSPTNLAGLSLGLQDNGQILVAGSLRTLSVLTNTEAAAESLTYLGTTLTWLRGGTSPEVWWSRFEYSTNGTDWHSLGNGSRISGGWALSGVLLPPGYTLRTSGGVSGGYCNDSCWLAQSYIGSPVLTTQPTSRTNYVGTPGSLTAFAQGSQPLSYQWFRNSIPIPGATKNTLPFPSIRTMDAGFYSVVVSNQFGSSTSSVATVTVLSLPQIVINDGSFGFANGQFGFNIIGPSGQSIVVEWSGTFATWVPLQTNVLGNSPFYFSEPRSTKYSRKFYRVRVVQN